MKIEHWKKLSLVEGLYREGEEGISKDGYMSSCYAVGILKGRFRAGEEAMKGSKNVWHWRLYVKYLADKGIEI